MTLQQLRYVIEIVNCGSMNAAAEKLFVTQPSLSNAVKELEKELGIEIFLRSSRGISLSAEGAEFLGYARQVVEQAELLEGLQSNLLRLSAAVGVVVLALSLLLSVMLTKRIGRLLTAIRLLLLPVALCLVLRALGIDSLVLGIAVTQMAMPVAVNGTLLSMEYGGDTECMAQITFLTTAASIVTIPIVAVLLL